MRIKVARNPADLDLAANLLYRQYLDAGLIEPNATLKHQSEQTRGEHARAFLSMVGDDAVGCVTVFHDGPQQLPIDKIYPIEMAWLRTEFKIVEFGELANAGFSVLARLLHYAYWHAYHWGAHRIVCVTSPIHAGIYQRVAGAETIGPKKVILNAAPAMLSIVPVVPDEPKKWIRAWLADPLTPADVGL